MRIFKKFYIQTGRAFTFGTFYTGVRNLKYDGITRCKQGMSIMNYHFLDHER